MLLGLKFLANIRIKKISWSITKNAAYGLLGLFICFIYSLTHQFGIYGYGIDYRDWYGLKNNMLIPLIPRDQLGMSISTLTIYGHHVGVLATSLLLTISSLVLLNNHFKHQKPLMLMSLVLCLHTWPIIMQVSNGMRQGIMASFLFLALVTAKDHKKITLFLLLLVIFSHNSGLFFAAIFMGTWICVSLNLDNFFTRIIAGLLGCIPFWLALDGMIEPGGSRVIGADFRIPFLLINIFISIFLLFRKNLNFQQLFIFYCSVWCPVILLRGGNFEYERLNQIIIIPTIIALASCIVVRDRYLFILVGLGSLSALTWYTGMFAALLPMPI